MTRFPETLRLGCAGDGVRWLQTLLCKQGQNTSVDGRFGSATQAAVMSVQRKLNLIGDGIVGPATWGGILPRCVSYKQMDPRWGKMPYTVTGDTSQTIASSGCGPACMAMIAATWRDPEITPLYMCERAIADGYRTRDSGTSSGFFAQQAKELRLNLSHASSIEEVRNLLAEDALVVANMGPGYWTRAGHYIVIWTHDPISDTLYANDPGSSSRYRASAVSVGKEAKRFFVFKPY